MSSEQPEQDTTVTVPKSTLTKAGLEHSSSPDSIGPDQHIEAEEREDDFDETDSTLGDDVHSDTDSLRSSVTNYIQENGRRYHAPASKAYYLPNDEAELDRLDLLHHCPILRTDGKLHLAPIDPHPQRILDLGTGTGIWAIEMGDKYPSAEVLGNDISPVQPTLVPPNVIFEVDDIEKEWLFSSKFDFIHARALCGCIKDWPRLIRQAYEFTKPGGWVEFQDFDMAIYSLRREFKTGCPADRWGEEVAGGVSAMGLEPHPGHQLEKWVKDAGFTNIVAQLFPTPIGQWPKEKKLKEVGAFDLLQFLDGLEGISLRVFTQIRGWTVEETKLFLALVRKDLLNSRMQLQHDYYIVYGQKPYDITSRER